jgi:hypothetical protein
MSFGGKPSGDGLAKRYELHYQLKKVGANGGEKYQLFGCINFHGRRGSGLNLTPVIKNKRSAGWMKAWFYGKVPKHLCAQGEKTVHILYSYMCSLEFRTEPPSTMLTMTWGTLPLSRRLNLLEVMMLWRNS